MLGGKNSLRRNLLALLVAAPWLLVVVVRLLSLDAVWPLIPLVAFTPQTLVTLLFPLLVAVVLRARWAALVVVLAGVALALVVAPRLSADDQPTTAGRTVRVFTANLMFGSVDATGLAAAIRSARPDIVALQEASTANVEALRAKGVLRGLPYVEQHSAEGKLANFTLSRWALDDVEPGAEAAGELGAGWPALRVREAGIVFYNVHSSAPTTPGGVASWRTGLDALPAAGGGGRLLTVIAGDLNATLDHRAFRRVLARGYIDTGSVTGNGLVWTWSVGRIAQLVIDHVLVPPSVEVLSHRVIDLPGSDHNAVAVTLRLPRS
jgi:endonuclease/exonuclease/phosphatase family metal-dependent hydrolase